MQLEANPGKVLELEVDGKTYLRLPIKTDVIKPSHDIVEVVSQFTKGLVQKGDLLVVSEKVVAITQGRAFKIDEIKPRPLAVFLSKFVHRSPYGIGLGSPETMELALQEVGSLKILFSALVAAIGKIFGIRGLFYRICGDKARAIDGPCDYTLPPYDNYVVKGPLNPELVAKQISSAVGCAVAIIDANDLGVNVLGVSESSIDNTAITLLEKLLKDNPLGQSTEQTPFGIIRLAEKIDVAEPSLSTST